MKRVHNTKGVHSMRVHGMKRGTNILVLNVGSSSLRYEVFRYGVHGDGHGDKKPLLPLLLGSIDGIGTKTRHHSNSTSTHALRLVLNHLQKEGIAIHAVGHRVVHGGKQKKAVRISSAVLKQLKAVSSLAPLHNPFQLIAIKESMKLFLVPHIAVFDTAFHQAMPEYVYTYPLPYRFAKQNGIRKYGFHGTSHQYVSQEACRVLAMPPNQQKKQKIISCHLGNGCSITAVHHGKVLDTSMGFTPLEGLMMGTRCGDIDPSIPLLLIKKGYSLKKIEDMLNHESGLLGISGISSDIRPLLSLRRTHARVRLALDMFAYRIAKYIGAYTAAMDGVDIIVFTGGIGEHAPFIRERVLRHFHYLGITIDRGKNRRNNKKKKKSTMSTIISARSSKVKVLVVSTNEALMIAREVRKVV